MTADWVAVPPRLYDVVTGFFPEAKPKHNWSENPRPMLVVGVFRGKNSRRILVRVAYGTSQVGKAQAYDLSIHNLSSLDALNLACPTAFVLTPGSNMAILEWSEVHFSPWQGFSSPIISRLPADMQEYVKEVVSRQPDLPMPR